MDEVNNKLKGGNTMTKNLTRLILEIARKHDALFSIKWMKEQVLAVMPTANPKSISDLCHRLAKEHHLIRYDDDFCISNSSPCCISAYQLSVMLTKMLKITSSAKVFFDHPVIIDIVEGENVNGLVFMTIGKPN
jgi:hypothetical protein